MARNLMPKSGIMMPYVVVSRDAAVVGVSTVDGKAGAVDLTTTYRKITDSYTKTQTYTKTEVDNLITPLMTGALFKADPFVNNNVPFRSGGANGVTSINLIKANTDNSIHIGDIASGVQGVHIFSEGRVDVIYKNDAGAETVAPMYSKRHRPEVADMPFAAVGDYVLDSQGRTIAVNRTGINSDLKTLNALTNISTTKVTFEKSPTIPDAALPYDAVNLKQLQAAGVSGDATKPASGILVSGGSVASVYQVAGVDYAKAEIKVKSIIDGKPYAEVAITDNSSGIPSINNLRLGPPKSYIDGLDLYVSSTGVTVYPGSAMLATGEFVEVVNSITKTLPAKTESTFYYVYLFLNAGVPDIEVSTTAPTKYSGKASSKGSDLTRRFLGYYRVTSSNEVAECSCINGTTRYTGPVDANSILRIMANGVATSYTQIPIAGYMVAGIARSIIFDGTNTASGATAAYSGMSGRTYSTFQSGNNKYEAEVFFNDPASPQLWYKYSSSPGSTGFYVDIKGFRYDR